MVITMSLNPSIDRTVSVEKFQYGGMNRVVGSRDDAGGKAVNLSLVLSALGVKTKCVGLLPLSDGQVVLDRLEAAGVETNMLRTEGRVRVNIKLLDESAGIITEINERGSAPDPSCFDSIVDMLPSCGHDGDWLVLTGSLPPGCAKDYYARLARAAGGRYRVAIDAEGEPLRLGIGERPRLIKPNLAELEGLIGRQIAGLEDAADAARQIHQGGVETVIVTLGADGALLLDAEGALYAPAVAVDVRSTVGAGDSMVAGYLAGVESQMPREDRFRMGIAAAAASVSSEGTQAATRDEIDRFFQQTRVRRL